MKRSIDDALTSSPQQRQQLILSPGQAQMSTASSAQRLTTNDALTYLKAVKEIFQDRKDKYDEFLDIMKDFKAQRVDTHGVTARVKELFKGHRDLILGFNTFLPPGYKITLPLEEEPFMRKKPVEFDEAISFVNKIKARFHGDDHVYKSFLGILNMYRKDNKLIHEVYQEVSILFQDHADLLVEFTHFLPDATGTAYMHLAQPGRNHIPFGDDRGSPMTTPRSMYIDKKPAVPYPVRDRCADNQDSEWNHDEKEKGTRDVKDNNDWEDGDSLDHKRKIARRDDSLTDQFHQGMNPIPALCEKVQDRLQDPENYKKFLDCVRSYESKFVNTPQFRMLVANLLGGHPDLMDECEDLITYVEKIGSMRNSKHISRSSKGEDRDGDHHDREERNKNRDFGNRESDRYDRGLPSKDLPARMSSYASKEKFLLKPIQELDLSNCESCTPSYRLLPENYPIPTASRRTEIGAQVLNDHWVSVTSGSEDYSFKHMRKNQYEESLFRCEDDRFELDMLLESVNTTAVRVEELLDSMNAHTIKLDAPFYIEDHLTALNLRCIERLYGDHGLDVMDVLRKNAPLALPVILTRLKQKQEEWAKCRADFNKVWAEIYAKNYHKSLDHRSFYFKQQDSKNLSPKALLAEIKEISEENQNEDEMVLSIGAGYRQPIRPHIEFGYPDPEIHEDLFQLMKFSCGEACTPEQCEKIMKIWKNFVEIVLGVASHPDKAEGTEDVKANVANVCEGTSSSLLIAGADNGSNIDGVPNVSCGSNVLCTANAPESGAISTPLSIKFATPVSSKQTGHPEQGTAHALGELSVNDETASDLQTGTASTTTLVFRTGATLNGDSQVSVGTRSASFPTEIAPQAVKAQQGHDETEACADIQCEEGKLPGGSNLNKKSFASSGNNTGTKALENPSKSSVSSKGTGGEKICTEEAEGGTDLNADDEEMCTQGSTDCENASENGDASVSESADGEEGFPEEPDEDGAHDKAESEGEADCTANAQDNGVQPSTRRSLRKVKPLNMIVPPGLQGKEKHCEIFYGNDSFYILFRLHQILYERMKSAKQHSTSPDNKWRILNKASAAESYARFKDALHSLLNGSSDNTKFEDDCRAIIGAQSYVLFTLDKLIHRLVKQLQVIAAEEVDIRLLQLYAYERSRGPEKFADAVYHENARFVVPEDNLYRIECRHFPARFTMQLMRNELDKPEVTAVSMDPNFATYLNEELLSVNPQRKEKPGVFLMRNKRRWLTGDETSDTDKVMEGVQVYNGLEIKIACNTLKAAYVLDTEDYLYRPRKFRKTLYPNPAANGSNVIPREGAARGEFYKMMCC